MPKKNAKKSKPAKKTTKAAPKKKGNAKVTKKASAPVQEKVSKKEETMDRSALKVIASQLKEIGSDIKVLKSDTDELLQKKINEHLQKLPKDEALKRLETISPDKLISVLKRDCLGIFIDLSDVSCVNCKDVTKCASQFIHNLKGGFGDLAKALPDTKVEEKPTEKVKIKAVSRYEEDRLVIVMDRPNPNPVGDTYHDTFQKVLDEGGPMTLGELRAIVEQDFDIDGDGDFMKFVTAMRDPAEGIIKLDIDLSEKQKSQLRKAGVEV